MQAGNSSRFRTIALWAVAYVATMTAILWGLQYGRDIVVDRLGDPASVAAWREWAEETRRPTDPDQPVERRPVKSDEPPALILMRDHFGSVRAVALVIGTFVFAFLGFLAGGIWSQRGTAPGASRNSTQD